MMTIKKNMRFSGSTALVGTALAASPILMSTLVVGLTTAPASAQQDSAARVPVTAADYVCTIDGLPSPQLVTLTLRLADAPDSVKAGDVLFLSGRLTATFPDTIRTTSQVMLASQAAFGVSELSLGTKLGGTPGTVTPVLAADDAAPIEQPFVLGAGVTTPAINVPTDARGPVEIYLPFAEDDKPAFTTTIIQNSVLQPRRSVSCANETDGKPVRAARIPIKGSTVPTEPVAGEAAGQDEGAAAGGAGVVSSPSGASASLGGGLVAEPPPVAELPAVPEPVRAEIMEVDTVTNGNAPAPVALQEAAIPAATAPGGTFVPLWTLAIMGLSLPAAAIALALRQRALLAGARTQLDGLAADEQGADAASRS